MMIALEPPIPSRSGTVDRVLLRVRHRTALVSRLTRDIEDTAENAFANWHRDRYPEGGHLEPALEAFGGAHCDGADPAFTEVLLHFEGDLGRNAIDVERDLKRLVDLWELA